MSNKPGKRWRSDIEKAPKSPVALADAVSAVLQFDKGKFDQTIELVMSLGIDPRQADQAIRGSISLPHGVGSAKKVIAFCEGEEAEAAKAAGAIEAGSDDLIQKVQDGWLDFDVAISTPAMMRNVSRLGRVLGPQGKMPSPKSGTVTQDVATAVSEFAAGKLEYRNDAGGNVAVIVGKMSFDAKLLEENAQFFIDHIRHRKPAACKSTYIRKVCMSGTMTPSVMVDTTIGGAHNE